MQYIMELRNGSQYQVKSYQLADKQVVRMEHCGSAFLKVMPQVFFLSEITTELPPDTR